MDWENKTIGFAMCGSFCTFKKAMGVLEKLTQTGANVIPIMSEMSYNTDTRFGKAEDFRTNITNLTGNNIGRWFVERKITPPQPVGWVDYSDGSGGRIYSDGTVR